MFYLYNKKVPSSFHFPSHMKLYRETGNGQIINSLIIKVSLFEMFYL